MKIQRGIVLLSVAMLLASTAGGCQPPTAESGIAMPSVTGATPSPETTPMPEPVLKFPCQPLAYDDGEGREILTKLQFCNNTPDPLMLRRIDVDGLLAVVMPPDTLAQLFNGGPAAGTMDPDVVAEGPGMVFGVYDEAEQLRGRFLITAEFLREAGFQPWLCLSLASEPPFEVHHGADLPVVCP